MVERGKKCIDRLYKEPNGAPETSNEENEFYGFKEGSSKLSRRGKWTRGSEKAKACEQMSLGVNDRRTIPACELHDFASFP